MNKILITVLAVVLLALVAVSTIMVIQLMEKQKLSIEKTNFELQLINSQQAVSKLERTEEGLEKERAALQTKLDKLTEEKDSMIDSLVDQLAGLEEKEEALNTQISDLTKTLQGKEARINKLQTENKSLTSKFMCNETLSNVDFTNNESVNKSLVKYVNDTKSLEEPISAHYWNLIWTKSKYSIHTIEVHSQKDRMNYIWKFTVYFRGESHGDHENGIFYNDDQCWMYLDK